MDDKIIITIPSEYRCFIFTYLGNPLTAVIRISGSCKLLVQAESFHDGFDFFTNNNQPF